MIYDTRQVPGLPKDGEGMSALLPYDAERPKIPVRETRIRKARCQTCGGTTYETWTQNGTWHQSCPVSPAGRMRLVDKILGG